MSEVLLSIHSKYAELIYSCEKTIEIRKTTPNDKNFSGLVYLYETAPIMKVTGFIKVDRIIVYKNINDFIERGGCLQACISQNELTKYVNKKNNFFGWHISEAKKFIYPKFLFELKSSKKNGSLKRPPQSWCYI